MSSYIVRIMILSVRMSLNSISFYPEQLLSWYSTFDHRYKIKCDLWLNPILVPSTWTLYFAYICLNQSSTERNEILWNYRFIEFSTALWQSWTNLLWVIERKSTKAVVMTPSPLQVGMMCFINSSPSIFSTRYTSLTSKRSTSVNMATYTFTTKDI